ncbi:hypothetical protein J4G37_22850 [Microvirga sp. 3-52]|nr:hypothetical protein [Microvirga sp. 3-52]
MMERLGVGPPWNSSASAMRGALLFARSGSTVGTLLVQRPPSLAWHTMDCVRSSCLEAAVV